MSSHDHDHEEEETKRACCAGQQHGNFYRSPEEAMKGPREKVLIVAMPNYGKAPDAVATIDVDPESPEYCKIISLLELPNVGDELHHFSWNACASCLGNPCAAHRTHLIFPSLTSGRIYIVDASNPRELKLEKSVEPLTLSSLNLSHPHTAHCAPDSVMISTIGDAELNNQGNFFLLDPVTFEPKGKWPADGRGTTFGYDFWFQPRHNVMLSTGWGSPSKFRKGFWPSDVTSGYYSNEINVWEWSSRKLVQTIKLEGDTGWVPFELRFLHNPDKCHAFVCTVLGSSIYHLYREKEGEPFQARLAASIPAKKVEHWPLSGYVPQFVNNLMVTMGWALPKMPAFCADMVISMDDRFLFVSNMLHGDVRQYDISDPFNIKLVGQCFVGGSIHKGSGVKVIEDEELNEQPEIALFADEGKPEGGPNMLQLSLDGKRLYVTNSIYLPYDSQFFPELPKRGSTMVQLDVDTQNGGLTVNKKFRVEFGKSAELPNGPYAAHEMRYPGGDCTSDIWQ